MKFVALPPGTGTAPVPAPAPAPERIRSRVRSRSRKQEQFQFQQQKVDCNKFHMHPNGPVIVILSEAKDLDPEIDCGYEILRFAQDDKMLWVQERVGPGFTT